MQIQPGLINMTWTSGAKCKKKPTSRHGERVLFFFSPSGGELRGEEEEGVIKSSGTLSLPGLGWQPVNRRGQSGFISCV